MLRRLDPSDPATAAAIVAVQRAAYAVEARLAGIEDLPPLRETAADVAAAGLTYLGDELAFVAYRRDADTVDVHKLVVHPSVLRQGRATRLLDALDACERDAARWVVATAANNAPAVALYERRGFRVVARRLAGAGVAIVELERTA